MADRLDQVLAQALDAGVLPASAVRPPDDSRPWPVVLLTALGAWLAAVPLLIVIGLLLGDVITHSIGPYVVGLLVLAAALVMLRSRSVPLFFEQLAVPALLVGAGSLGFGVFRDLPDRAGALLLALVALGLALAVARAWLRVLLGAAMATLVGFALLGPGAVTGSHSGLDEAWLACHGLLAIWIAALWAQPRARQAATLIETVGAGWLLVTLAALAFLAGMTFLVGGALGGGVVGGVARELSADATRSHLVPWGLQGVSAALALAAGAVAARTWPQLKQPPWAVVGVVGAGLSWLLPTLGGAGLALALAATTQRWRLAAAAAVAATWIVGSFYYQLAWPLGSKALVLVAAGAVLGALAWWLARRSAVTPAPTAAAAAARRLDRGSAWLALGTLATAAVAGVAIWQKQDVIAQGRPVFVELAPVDPRSLMQGDYMQLNFGVPGDVPQVLGGARPQVVARRDARGVAMLSRLHGSDTALAADEFLIELTPKNGGWILVTDAWFFKEGDGARWALARYGEFRVAPDGRALLVGMADAQLKPITP